MSNELKDLNFDNKVAGRGFDLRLLTSCLFHSCQLVTEKCQPFGDATRFRDIQRVPAARDKVQQQVPGRTNVSTLKWPRQLSLAKQWLFTAPVCQLRRQRQARVAATGVADEPNPDGFRLLPQPLVLRVLGRGLGVGNGHESQCGNHSSRPASSRHCLATSPTDRGAKRSLSRR